MGFIAVVIEIKTSKLWSGNWIRFKGIYVKHTVIDVIRLTTTKDIICNHWVNCCGHKERNETFSKRRDSGILSFLLFVCCLSQVDILLCTIYMIRNNEMLAEMFIVSMPHTNSASVCNTGFVYFAVQFIWILDQFWEKSTRQTDRLAQPVLTLS